MQLAALDIGSAKIVCLIAQSLDPPTFQLKSCAHTPSKGFYAGEVINFFDAVESLRRNVAEAEEKIHVRVKGVFAHSAFRHTLSRSIYVKRAINGYVTGDDIEALTTFAYAQIKPPPGWQVIHSQPVCFFVDNIKMVGTPHVLPANELGVLMHATLVKHETVIALKRCLDQAHLELLSIVPSPYASAWGCLEAEDSQNGVIHIDMGHSLTNASIFIYSAPACLVTQPSVSGTDAAGARAILTQMHTQLKKCSFYTSVSRRKVVLSGRACAIVGMPSLVQSIFPDHTVVTAYTLNGLLQDDIGELDPLLNAAAAGTLLHGAQTLITASPPTTHVTGKLHRAWQWVKEHF